MDILINKLEKIVLENKAAFSVFSNKSYSFEEWLNMELCIALNADPDITDVRNTPAYGGESKERLDIDYKFKSKKYAIEIKIAHPRTQEKYKYSCQYDLEKLKSSIGYDKRFFIMIVASTLSSNDFSEDDLWTNWLYSFLDKESAKKVCIDLGSDESSVNIYIQKVSHEVERNLN